MAPAMGERMGKLCDHMALFIGDLGGGRDDVTVLVVAAGLCPCLKWWCSSADAMCFAGGPSQMPAADWAGSGRGACLSYLGTYLM